MSNEKIISNSSLLTPNSPGSSLLTHNYFDCDCCGLCCKNVGKTFMQAELDRGDGVCKNFDDETKLCKIYKSRPLVCNVDAYYEKFLSEKMSREDFYKINYKVCKKLKSNS